MGANAAVASCQPSSSLAGSYLLFSFLASLASWRFVLWGLPLPDELSSWIRFGQRDARRQGNSTAKTPRTPRGEGMISGRWPEPYEWVRARRPLPALHPISSFLRRPRLAVRLMGPAIDKLSSIRLLRDASRQGNSTPSQGFGEGNLQPPRRQERQGGRNDKLGDDLSLMNGCERGCGSCQPLHSYLIISFMASLASWRFVFPRPCDTEGGERTRSCFAIYSFGQS